VKGTGPNKLSGDLATVEKAVEISIGSIKADLKQEQADLLAATKKIDFLLGEEGQIGRKLKRAVVRPSSGEDVPKVEQCESWDATLTWAKDVLASEDVPEPNSAFDLLPTEKLQKIYAHLNRPAYKRLSWDKWDYGFVFGVGIAAGCLDIFLGTPRMGLQAQMSDKSTWIGSQMDSIHGLHSPNAPIDYQGEHFGGPYHRGLTTGHDLLRPLSGIRQFMNGEFSGFYWVNGQKIAVESAVNQFGSSYTPMGLGAAILAWMVHMFADFVSTTSLPIPGTSFVQGVNNHRLRQFVQRDLYQHGINLRHVVLQTIPPLFIEVVLRSYAYLRFKGLRENPDALAQKKMELLTVGHMICGGFNVGKVVLMNDPTQINVPQMMALARTMFRLACMEYKRNSFAGRIIRNTEEMQLDLDVLYADSKELISKNISTPIQIT